MITKKQAETLQRLIKELVEHSIEDANSGAGYPEDIPQIELELLHAKINLDTYIVNLTSD